MCFCSSVHPLAIFFQLNELYLISAAAYVPEHIVKQKELYFLCWSKNCVWNMYCRWEINIWATEVGWCSRFVSQWWLVLCLLHKVCTVPLLKPVQVLLDDTPSLWALHLTAQSLAKFAMGALSPTVLQMREAAYYLQAFVLCKWLSLNLGIVRLCQLPFSLPPAGVTTGYYRAWLMLTLVEICVLLH